MENCVQIADETRGDEGLHEFICHQSGENAASGRKWYRKTAHRCDNFLFLFFLLKIFAIAVFVWD